MLRRVVVENMKATEEVLRAAYAEKPWFFYVVFVEGKHDKFWEAWGCGSGEMFVRYGRRNSVGNTLIKPFSYFVRTAPKKLNKGYTNIVFKEKQVEVPDSFDIEAYLLEEERTPSKMKEAREEILKEDASQLVPGTKKSTEAKAPAVSLKKKPSLKELAAKRRAKAEW